MLLGTATPASPHECAKAAAEQEQQGRWFWNSDQAVDWDVSRNGPIGETDKNSEVIGRIHRWIDTDRNNRAVADLRKEPEEDH